MKKQSDHRILKGLTRQKLQDAVLLLSDSFVVLQLSYGEQEGIIYMELFEPNSEEELSVYSTANKKFFDLHLDISGTAGDDELALGDVLEEFIYGDHRE